MLSSNMTENSLEIFRDQIWIVSSVKIVFIFIKSIMHRLDVIEIRKKLKLTQEDFGKLIGVDKRTIINYEQGKVIPKTKVSLLESVLANGLVNSTLVDHTIKEVPANVNINSLLDDIAVLKDHIKTLKDLIIEKTKLSEMYINENAVLRDRIKILTNSD